MAGVRLLKQQQLVKSAINQMAAVTTDRRVRKDLQMFKEEIKHLEDLEDMDYEQGAVGEADDLPRQELSQRVRVKEAIQSAEDRLEDLEIKVT